MVMPGRNYATAASDYRFGFNGKEHDLKSGFDAYDFGGRMYDERLGRWMSTDPSESKYPGISTYNFSYNSPIMFNDPNGEDGRIAIDYENKKITIESTIHIYGPNAHEGMAKILESQFNNMLGTIGEFESIDGEVWRVEIKVTFNDKNIGELNRQTAKTNSFPNAVIEEIDLSKLKGFENGDNIMLLSDKNASGEYGLSAVGYPSNIIYNNAFEEENERTIFHEALHEIGFDHWNGPGVAWVKTSSDIYNKYSDVMESGVEKAKNLMIHPFHYESILRFAKKMLPLTGIKPYNKTPIQNDLPNKSGLKKSEGTSKISKRGGGTSSGKPKYTNKKHYKKNPNKKVNSKK